MTRAVGEWFSFLGGEYQTKAPRLLQLWDGDYGVGPAGDRVVAGYGEEMEAEGTYVWSSHIAEYTVNRVTLPILLVVS